jgi:DNA repair protein RecO (recombination protein O)
LKAKAIRKITSKLRADIDLFYLAEIEFIQGKNNKTLTDASKIDKFNSIIKNPESLAVAYQIADILDSFLRGQEKDEKTFSLLNEIFYKLSEEKYQAKNNRLLFQYFFWNFISLQGYKLEVYNCASCQQKLDPGNIYFSGKEGGVICKECINTDKDVQKINCDIVKRIILKKDWDTFSRLKVEQPSLQLLSTILDNALLSFCPI